MIKPKLHDFENSILNNLLDKDYINHNETIIIAVSGGKDSMALLYAMTRINPLLKIKIVAAHINHHLRENSSEDELFIRTFCKEQNIELIIDHLNPSQKLKSMSKEEWARDFRYKSLYRISSDYGSCNIMTAHHGNDQIETILFHLSQGAGLAGLRGIHTQRDRVIRPLLSLSRKEINVYLEEMDIPWVQDKTNNDTTIPRNFLRHKIIKSWEKENSGLVSSFNQISQNIKDAYESLMFSAKILIPQLIINKDNDQIYLDGQQIKALPKYLLSIVFKEITQTEVLWRRHEYFRLYKFIKYSKTGQIFDLNNNWKLLKDRDRFILNDNNKIKMNTLSVLPDTKINVDKHYFSWCSSISKEHFKNSNTSEIIDANKIRNKTLTLRLWKEGDRFTPLGMKGSKKLSDFFIDEKIDIFSKNNQWLLLDGSRIIWVCGRRVSDHVKITSNTTKYGKLIFSK